MPRTIRKGFGEGTIPWIDYTAAMVNHYYFYYVDEDFGPFFIKFYSYFPYTDKLSINGHEYLNWQLARRGIEFEALDNGLLRCADPAAANRIAAFDEKIRHWLDNIGSDVVSEIRYFSRPARALQRRRGRGSPSTPIRWKTITPGRRPMCTIEGIALRFILAFWPGARHSQIVAKLMEVAHRGAVTNLEPELLLEKSMDFDSYPVKLASFARILQDWH